MPIANNNGFNIYYEVEGSGPPVVLAHGLSMSIEDWKDHGYVESLSTDFKLILVDSIGHGRSDKPHDTARYTRHNRALDHIAVLDHLGIEKAHFVGYSMGGSACFYAGIHAPDRCITLALGGFQPFPADEIPEDFPPHAPHNLKGLPPADDPIRYLLSKGSEAWIDFFSTNMTVNEAMATRLAKNDYGALVACRDSPDDRNISRLLENLDQPCLIYVGEYEYVYRGSQYFAQELPSAELVSLPGFNHFEIFAESGIVIPILQRFLIEHS